MGIRYRLLFFVFGLCVSAVLSTSTASTELQGVAFPERETITLPIINLPAAPSARLEAEVTYKKGQAQIQIQFSQMKPAILFGGDITCYVVWAITRDGRAENLGELLTPKQSGHLAFYTGQKSFALVITAESYYLVSQPSELVMFRNVTPLNAPALASSFEFEGFASAPEHYMDGISHLKWDSDVPLELLQARKAFELATQIDAAQHAAQIYEEASQALARTNELSNGERRSRELIDASRRAVALSNEALNISNYRLEAIRVEQELVRRRAETAALEQRAAEAESASVEAQRLTQQAREEAQLARSERERAATETAALRAEKATLDAAMGTMRSEKARLVAESERLRVEKEALELEKAEQQQIAQRLQQEKDEVAGRLQAALSHVATTTDSARGFVVNLPDILFDVDEATLKPDAQLVLSKLAGILLMLPEQLALIEGYTDSTGSADYNLSLSDQRANVVLSLLANQGIERTRLQALGLGMQRPVAANDTPEGRRQNRRVEIVISGNPQGVAAR